jgi:hypothetical protein
MSEERRRRRLELLERWQREKTERQARRAAQQAGTLARLERSRAARTQRRSDDPGAGGVASEVVPAGGNPPEADTTGAGAALPPLGRRESVGRREGDRAEIAKLILTATTIDVGTAAVWVSLLEGTELSEEHLTPIREAIRTGNIEDAQKRLHAAAQLLTEEDQ